MTALLMQSYAIIKLKYIQ